MLKFNFWTKNAHNKISCGKVELKLGVMFPCEWLSTATVGDFYPFRLLL